MDTIQTNTAVENVPTVAPKTPEQIHRVNLREFLRSTGGKLVGIDFVKADGSDRFMIARLGVRKHLKGRVNTVEGTDRPYLTMFDMDVAGYRSVNLATVSCVRSSGRRYDVIG